MRFACLAVPLSLAVLLSLESTRLFAFELETTRTYEVKSEKQVLRIISTADIDVFEPIITAFQNQYPNTKVVYDVASSTQLMAAIYDEGATYDLAISSAMDLQTKLANDGFAKTHISEFTRDLPAWANWRDQVFAFTQEPAVLVLSEEAFKDIAVPTSREELIDLLRSNPSIFDGKVGTYDVRESGLGYLFATQDSRNTDSFWRLTEIMGRLNTKLYCCSGAMIDDVASGHLAIAYNVLGSYANSKLVDTPGIRIIEMDDFVSVMLRTALIPTNARNIGASGLMIDFLSQIHRQPQLLEQISLPSLVVDVENDPARVRPIRIGPGLLVFLDRMRRENFLRSWVSSIEQN